MTLGQIPDHDIMNLCPLEPQDMTSASPTTTGYEAEMSTVMTSAAARSSIECVLKRYLTITTVNNRIGSFSNAANITLEAPS